MPRPCSVCQHADRLAIDRALVEGTAYREIVRQFRSVSKDGLSRHKAAHVSPALVRVVERREARQAERGPRSVLERLETLYERAVGILDRAEGAGQTAQELGALRELRGLADSIARITGELKESPAIAVNVLASPELTRYTAELLRALGPYPAARVAAAAALRRLDIEAPE